MAKAQGRPTRRHAAEKAGFNGHRHRGGRKPTGAVRLDSTRLHGRR